MPSAATFAVLAFVMLPAVDPRGVYDTKRIAALQSQLTSHSGHPQLWLELGQSFAGYARADNGPVDDASLLQAVKSSVACYQAAIRLVSGDTGARPVSGVSRRPHTQHAAATRATRLRSEAYSVMGAISAEFGAVDRRPPRHTRRLHCVRAGLSVQAGCATSAFLCMHSRAFGRRRYPGRLPDLARPSSAGSHMCLSAECWAALVTNGKAHCCAREARHPLSWL
jgi:hypothetical protein